MRTTFFTQTEFGGIVGLFAPDEVTAAYISKRPSAYRKDALYFQVRK
jgi:homoaconitase/3-isopropylmalate dehydratase large subunit